MSFDRISNSIENLSAQETITLDLLFDMMVCVSQDVMAHNKISDLSDTPVGEQSVLLKKVYNLMNITLAIYNKNKEGISSFGSSIQDRYIKLVDEMNGVLSEIKKVNQEVKNAENKEEELKTESEKLQIFRGHLLEVFDECEKLQKQIDLLSDPILDEKEKEKVRLETELNIRKETSNSLDESLRVIREEFEELMQRIDTTNKSIIELNGQKQSLENEENELLITKNGLEKGVENIKYKLEVYNEWIKNYPVMSEQISKEFNDTKEKIGLMINAVNSTISESYLKDNLFRISDKTDIFDIENYPDCNVAETHFENIDEMQDWFDKMKERINSLVDVYEKMIVTLVKESDKLTNEIS